MTLTDFIKSFLIGAGAIVLTLAVAGMFGIGHFRLYYGGDPLMCVVKEPK